MHTPDCRRCEGRSYCAVTHVHHYLRSVLRRQPSQQFINNLCALAPVGTYAAMAEQILDGSTGQSRCW